MHGDTKHNCVFVIVVLYKRLHRRHIFVAFLTYNKPFLYSKYTYSPYRYRARILVGYNNLILPSISIVLFLTIHESFNLFKILVYFLFENILALYGVSCR